MKHVYEALEHLASTSGSKAKVDLLKQYIDIDPETLVEVFSLALDPMITFGITSKAVTTEAGGDTNVTVTNETIFLLLGELSSRKLTGNAAQEELNRLISHCCFQTAEVIKRILDKDLRCGMGISSYNKAGVNKISEFKPMLAHKYAEERIKEFPVYVEPKLDGMRCVAKVYPNGLVEFLSRKGLTITSIPHLESQVKEFLKGSEFDGDGVVVLDGELTSGENFNISISALRKKSEVAESAKFTIFEVLHEHEFVGYCKLTLKERIDRMMKLKNRSESLEHISRRVVDNHDDILKIFNTILDTGGEGVIVKPMDGIYENKRSYNWMKIKDCNDADLTIIGSFEGEGKYEGQLGGIIVDHKGVEVRVGSGLVDEERRLLWDNRRELIGLTAEVQYHEVTPDGSLRHPRFIQLREDK